MNHERIRFCVLASAMVLAGCGGMATPDRSFPVFFDNSAGTLDQPPQDIVVRAANDRRLDIAIAEPAGRL
jgi:hypothetical protein